MSEKPHIAKITKIVRETPSIKTYYLDYAMEAKPGQFAMVWLPGIDEKPFTLTAVGKECAITAQCKGKFTNAMCKLKEGDKLGIRGPYGNGFDTDSVKNACIVAGGCGAAPILLLAEHLQANNIETTIVLGARTGDECLFKEKLGKTTEKVFITTDDGSLGEKGFTTGILDRLLKEKTIDMVFCCGPEPMMKAVYAVCEKENVKCQLNLERWMRCGFGVCGACALGKFLVCKDGPVFTGEQLKGIEDFGKKAMLKSGKVVSTKEFGEWRQE